MAGSRGALSLALAPAAVLFAQENLLMTGMRMLKEKEKT